jgi:xanthine dehydrogenase YagS FAD-binding subunit
LVRGPAGERVIAFADFHRLPGDSPHIDTTLAEDELIVAVDLPAESFSTHVNYLKLRDRASYAFALVSVAAALQIQDGIIKAARLALGGVAHKPWRNAASEALLLGVTPVREAFQRAADAMLDGAQGLSHNTFKIPLARRAIVRALEQAAGAEASS